MDTHHLGLGDYVGGTFSAGKGSYRMDYNGNPVGLLACNLHIQVVNDDGAPYVDKKLEQGHGVGEHGSTAFDVNIPTDLHVLVMANDQHCGWNYVLWKVSGV